MDETTTPATPATPETNGHAQGPRWDDGLPDDPPLPPHEDKLKLSSEGWAYLADLKWVDEQYNLGHWDQYVGNYIAVHKKQLLGFGPNPLTLRERLAREHDLLPNRVVITYIEPSPIC